MKIIHVFRLRIFLMSAFLQIAFLNYGQVPIPDSTFVVMKDGKVFYGNKITPVHGAWNKITALKLDSLTLPASSVSIFSEGNYALRARAKGKFIESEYEGNLIIFKIKGHIRYGRTNGPHPGMRGTGTASRSRNKFWYVKGLEPVKRLNIINLKRDVKDNPIARQRLLVGEIYRGVTLLSYGTATATVGYLMFGRSRIIQGEDPLFKIAPLTLFTGLLSGAVFDALRRLQIKRCVKVYTTYEDFRWKDPWSSF